MRFLARLFRRPDPALALRRIAELEAENAELRRVLPLLMERPATTCVICGAPHHARGWCQRHYDREYLTHRRTV